MLPILLFSRLTGLGNHNEQLPTLHTFVAFYSSSLSTLYIVYKSEGCRPWHKPSTVLHSSPHLHGQLDPYARCSVCAFSLFLFIFFSCCFISLVTCFSSSRTLFWISVTCDLNPDKVANRFVNDSDILSLSANSLLIGILIYITNLRYLFISFFWIFFFGFLFR